jgi:type I restriction enzyme, S subunit
LREMVLQLAVTGALSEQVSTDGTGHELAIQASRLKILEIDGGNFKSTARLESLSLSIPSNITLPTSWTWTRLLDLGQINPRNECPDELEVSFLPMTVISQEHRGTLTPEVRRWKEIKKGFTHIADGDVILAKITPCFENGKSAVVTGLVNGFGAGTTELHVFRALPNIVEGGFVYLFLRSPFFAKIGEQNMTGTAGQKRLPTDYFASRAMPLPPLAEQKRIVAKVDELMALCDRLEALQTQRKNQRAVLTKELLGRVSQGDATDIQTCLQNLSYLVTDADQVPVIRKAILSLSVQGKLVKQDAKDEPSVILLKRISISSLKKESNHSSKTNFPSGELPHGWEWAKFQDIAEIASNLVDPKKFLDAIHLAPNNIEKATGVLLPCNTVREDKVSSANHRFFAGQIVYSKIRPNLSKVVVVDFDGLCSADMYPINAKIESIFLQRFMLSDEFLWQAVKNDTRIAMPKINQSELNEIWVKVPPLAEQKRIVAKVDELMALCDALETKLRKASDVQELLAQTSIAMLTGIQTQENKSMKAPKTELVARLTLGKKPLTKDQATLTALLVRHSGELSPNALHQHSSLSIDEFYHQLKFEMSQGWIVQPEKPTMRVDGRR